MGTLWTNSNSREDFVKNGILDCCESPSVANVYIASAFFTDTQTIEEIVANDCHVRLIVRLGYPTNAEALKKILNNNRVEIRYYTDSSFHPKLYIFGNEVALVGSANLTRAAVISNQEIVVSIDADDPRFDELMVLFNDYWQNSKVLDKETLDIYAALCNKHAQNMRGTYDVTQELQNAVGKSVFPNIDRGIPKPDKKTVFLEDYRKKYQEWVTAYEEIKAVYNSVGKRKDNISSVPMRIEIDAFVSYIRNTHAYKDQWEKSLISLPKERKAALLSHIQEWLDADWRYYAQDICTEKYPLISKAFSSQEAIEQIEYPELLKALEVLHSFSERLRFFSGGLSTLLKKFQDENDLKKVKASLSYLIFGKDDAVSRMANLIYNSDYKLHNFGLSNVQELIGWVNNDELPVVNSRTTKIFRFYGFDVKQI